MPCLAVYFTRNHVVGTQLTNLITYLTFSVRNNMLFLTFQKVLFPCIITFTPTDNYYVNKEMHFKIAAHFRNDSQDSTSSPGENKIMDENYEVGKRCCRTKILGSEVADRG